MYITVQKTLQENLLQKKVVSDIIQ